ncbi:arylamine N-acetyltransferase 1 [Coprinopsis marcescibilis]|uniref:Arylamine N-acetyltransferase 1 n=1 Tax=Coprinopsis marcescibilis TaxID=230819 RepID=A0A5C3KTN2_COPMA|nr:arylamine N-acetyltransferase 1 [Coprinopsis marcescibilis]
MPGYLQNQARITQIKSVYTPNQVANYLSAIKFEPTTSEDDIVNARFTTSVENLERIMRNHLLTFPWENTMMHYAPDHKMDVSANGLYERFIHRAQGGSYCFGQNGLLLEILRGLGYRAYSGSARVNRNFQQPELVPAYGSLNHMVLFVQPGADGSETFFVDVGFGAYGLVRPIPLSDSQDDWVYGAFPGEAHRFTRTLPFHSSLDPASNPAQKKWNLEVGTAENGVLDLNNPWKRLYSFTEEEFTQNDYEDANIAVSQTAEVTLFTENVLAVKYALDTSGVNPESDLCRLILYGKEVRKNGQAGSEVLRTLEKEHERLDALKQLFGIEISQAGIGNIQGRRPALPV